MEATARCYVGERILPLVDDQVVVVWFVIANVRGAKRTWRQKK